MSFALGPLPPLITFGAKFKSLPPLDCPIVTGLNGAGFCVVKIFLKKISTPVPDVPETGTVFCAAFFAT